MAGVYALLYLLGYVLITSVLVAVATGLAEKWRPETGDIDGLVIWSALAWPIGVPIWVAVLGVRLLFYKRVLRPLYNYCADGRPKPKPVPERETLFCSGCRKKMKEGVYR